MKAIALEGPAIVVRTGSRRVAFHSLAEAVRHLPPAQGAELLRLVERQLRCLLRQREERP